MTSRKKILYTATSDIHISTFHLPYLKWLKEQNCEIHLAIENRGDLIIPHVDNIFYLPFPRTPFHRQNISTLRQLKRIIDNGNYDLIHCHTPIPSVLTRLAAKDARKKGAKVLYTAHGFHFYKGAPLKMWLIFHTAEKFLSRYTDAIITINQEDFGYVNNKMHHKDSYYIKGIGIDTAKFKKLPYSERERIRSEYGYKREHFILLYIAEFIHRKNHQFIVESTPELKRRIPDLKILFAGKGVLMNQMKEMCKNLGLEDTIDFLGFRTDLGNLASISDVGISSSRQEGLGLGLAEQMLCGIPIIATEDRGHKEMIINGENGYMFPQLDKQGFISYVVELANDESKRKKLGENAYQRAQLFTIENSLRSMADIYRKYL